MQACASIVWSRSCTLRGPDGCAWDRQQTIKSLRPFVLQETYELLDALDRGDMSRSSKSSATFCSRRCSSPSSARRKAASRSPIRSSRSPTS